MSQRFLYRLNPPRSTFMRDMTAKEAGIMARHVAYWTGLLEAGVAIAFGPVADPAGSFDFECFVQTYLPMFGRFLGGNCVRFEVRNGLE